MTKAVRWAWAAVFLALAAVLPLVQAHGAPPVREIDVRVLLDDDGLVEYGGCAEGQCQPAAPAEGLDLLALDLREAAFPDGSPAIVFRVLVQSEAPRPGASIVLVLAAGGAETTLDLATADGLAYTSATFERVDGPFDVGDGHPKAIDGWVRHATLGVAAGDALTSITVESRHGETPDDAMPGGWYANGVEVPHLPHDADPGEAVGDPAPGAYTLKGAAPLVQLTAEPAAPDLSRGPATVTLRLTNPVALPQFADLAVAVGPGIAARLANPGVSLDASGARDVDLVVSDAAADGVVQVTLVSDLGAYETVNVTVKAPPAAANATATATPTHGPSEKASPAPALSLSLPLLAIAILLRRKVNP